MINKVVHHWMNVSRVHQRSTTPRASHTPIVSRIGNRMDQYASAIQVTCGGNCPIFGPRGSPPHVENVLKSCLSTGEQRSETLQVGSGRYPLRRHAQHQEHVGEGEHRQL